MATKKVKATRGRSICSVEPTTVSGQAAAIGVSDRVLARYRARGCPRGPIAAIKKWRADNISLAKRRLAEGEAPDEAKTELELQKLHEDIRYKKLKTDKLQKQLVHRAFVDGALIELRKKVTARLNRIPDELEGIPKSHAKRIRREVADKISLVLKELSESQI